ncbi:hypothetical protein HISP_01570 [Haloarcula hispanica N601]|uniref:Uncharacterized protein n=3 Tax=Haloarcula hispanica TaxID=51589 RepID=A0A482T7I2_HALHI|nr:MULTISPECIES: hypothetical protein [Haloarcula]AEM55923.1 conserved hypothetical protein [Haloarcula hispanica ATCC 33960]AHB64747.1 hypothetical protein HISP_01570 [Haloarcula hispanica N601]KAA9408679.1 hypothetical protein EGO51_02405 [Haloarcula hispanica]MCJ0620668.1 hypothetical protein [Haloarcula hispanica]MUV50374.1 hypothetical protein [Haloarcula sp. CBA1122]
MDWVARAESLLYDGEVIEADVRLDRGGVVVTSHRVLVFTPDREGSNYRQVDRPNVEGVDVTTSGDWSFLELGVKALVVGVVLVAAGMTVSLDSLVGNVSLDSGGAASAVGIGGMLGMLQTMLTLMAQLDDLMRLFGGLALAFAAVVLGVYLWSRDRLLVVRVAGDDDIELTAPDDESVVDRIEAAIVPEAPPADAGSAAQSAPDDPLP